MFGHCNSGHMVAALPACVTAATCVLYGHTVGHCTIFPAALKLSTGSSAAYSIDRRYFFCPEKPAKRCYGLQHTRHCSPLQLWILCMCCSSGSFVCAAALVCYHLDVGAGSVQVCKYIDIPLQHISNLTLLSMNRPPQEHTVKLLHKLRSRIPGLVLRTTFICGFPGEPYCMLATKTFCTQQLLNLLCISARQK